jgi:hypothetical protein
MICSRHWIIWSPWAVTISFFCFLSCSIAFATNYTYIQQRKTFSLVSASYFFSRTRTYFSFVSFVWKKGKEKNLIKKTREYDYYTILIRENIFFFKRCCALHITSRCAHNRSYLFLFLSLFLSPVRCRYKLNWYVVYIFSGIYPTSITIEIFDDEWGKKKERKKVKECCSVTAARRGENVRNTSPIDERDAYITYKKFREDVYTNTRSNRDYTLLYMMCYIVTIVTPFASSRYVPSF